jgi:hypothetical protein
VSTDSSEEREEDELEAMCDEEEKGATLEKKQSAVSSGKGT